MLGIEEVRGGDFISQGRVTRWDSRIGGLLRRRYKALKVPSTWRRSEPPSVPNSCSEAEGLTHREFQCNETGRLGESSEPRHAVGGGELRYDE
jgi:hypothetical protein